MAKFTTISLLPETREKLKLLGRKGETYDAIVNRLISDQVSLQATTFEPVESDVEFTSERPPARFQPVHKRG